MKCITFITTDQSIFYGIPCNRNSTFAEVEEKLRFKTINDNLIGTGKSVMSVKPS